MSGIAIQELDKMKFRDFPFQRIAFEKETRWGKGLNDEVVLEVGSGSGRFTPHALETRATVVSF